MVIVHEDQNFIEDIIAERHYNSDDEQQISEEEEPVMKKFRVKSAILFKRYEDLEMRPLAKSKSIIFDSEERLIEKGEVKSPKKLGKKHRLLKTVSKSAIFNENQLRNSLPLILHRTETLGGNQRTHSDASDEIFKDAFQSELAPSMTPVVTIRETTFHTAFEAH